MTGLVFYRRRSADGPPVAGLGWSALAIAGAAAALARQDVRDGEWTGFLVIAVAGHGFEGVWKAVRGTNALRFGQS